MESKHGRNIGVTVYYRVHAEHSCHADRLRVWSKLAMTKYQCTIYICMVLCNCFDYSREHFCFNSVNPFHPRTLSLWLSFVVLFGIQLFYFTTNSIVHVNVSWISIQVNFKYKICIGTQPATPRSRSHTHTFWQTQARRLLFWSSTMSCVKNVSER